MAERMASGGTIAGVGLMITLVAPFMALMLIPVLAVTAAIASVASAHVLANIQGEPTTRRNLALVCGAATGLALWAVSLLSAEFELAMIGALWLLPASLAMLTVNRFLFADIARLGYHER
jgi:hypothetical protein